MGLGSHRILFLRVNEVSNFGMFHEIAINSFFNSSIFYSKASMLSLVFAPGMKKKTLQVTPGNFGIIEDAPA